MGEDRERTPGEMWLARLDEIRDGDYSRDFLVGFSAGLMSAIELGGDLGAARVPDPASLAAGADEQTRAAIDEIAERQGISYTEVVRRAVAVYRFIENETAAGHTVHVRDGDRTKDVVLLL